MYFRIGVLMTFQMSKIKSVILGVRCLGHIRILTSVYVLNVILPEEAFKALLFKGTLNNQGKEFKIEIKISQMPVDNIQCEKD